jgi:SSS family solute:Na+ symporter
MTPQLVITFVLGYFLLLILISYLTGKNDDSDSFFRGNKQSPWYVVAFGMIGASLSGVTFISVPGWVATSGFSYMQMVLGYLVGYLVIGTVLLPLYYKLNLTSIYGYLQQRFGNNSYKTGASFFLLSRIIGASFRLYLVAMVFQYAVFDKMNLEVPFIVTVTLTILLIWIYTFRSGIKTIIWTDTLQTAFMLLSVVITIWLIGDNMNLSISGLINVVADSEYSQVFFFDDFNNSKHFVKQFLGGAFIAIVMTGLDQDMMQKNLTCKSLGDAQKNMFWFSIVLVFVNLLFLALGALLYIFAAKNSIPIPEKADQLFPMIAMDGYLGMVVSVFFILGLVAAAYSSADSALTSLTTSVCVDFMDIEKRSEAEQKKMRKMIHIGMSLVLIAVIMIFKSINDDSVISQLFKVAGYTYGPLLGLFSFGLFNKRAVKDKWVPLVCIISPILCYIINANSITWLGGYKFGFELLLLNGVLTYVGLLILSNRNEKE